MLFRLTGKCLLCGLLAGGLILVFGGCSDAPRESYVDKVPLSYAEAETGEYLTDWPDEKILEQFAGYWYYRFAGNAEQTWNREAPHFRKMAERSIYDNYILGGAGQRLTGIDVRRIDMMTENLARVLIKVDFQKAGRDLEVVLRDHWVLLGGDWFHVVRDPLAFPFSATFAEMG